MAASRSKTPAIGSAQWVEEERQYSQDLVAQELEDFGFSVRNELEWLNEHMADMFAHNGQNNLDVFKTPGKLRGKTPRTARKKATELRQPLADIFSTNPQSQASAAQQSLKTTLQKHTPKATFQIAEDAENASSIRSPHVQTPIARALFANKVGTGKENRDSPRYVLPREEQVPISRVGLDSTTLPVQADWSPKASTQDTVMDSQYDEDPVFTQETLQSTQPTQPAQSFRRSLRLSAGERRDSGESFVSAKEAFMSKNTRHEDMDEKLEEIPMDVDNDEEEEPRIDAQNTPMHSDHSPVHEPTTAIRREPSPSPARVFSEQYSIGAETHEALITASHQAQAPEPKNFIGTAPKTQVSSDPVVQHDDTVVHHDVEDQMDVDDEVRSPSDNSSPVKPLVRKSSLTFASLPAREPLIPKKSMGNRVSRTSHVDQARNSQVGRFTGGKSLGGAQYTLQTDANEDIMDIDHERPGLLREESETTKLHNHASTKSLKERLNMLSQRNDPPKRISQNIMAPRPSQPPVTAASQPAQPAYPHLPAEEGIPEPVHDADDEDDDWISPIKTTAPIPNMGRPMLNKSYSADMQPAVVDEAPLSQTASASNPDLPNFEESTTPAGSPILRRHDGPLSASKAKFYSALRAAKEKIIGSSAASAQVKLDALAESPMRPKIQAHSSSDDVFSSPKRNEKATTSIFSHLRSPSKESLKSSKSSKSSKTTVTSSSSPSRDDSRRTRSSSERERVKEKDAREKEAKQKQRAEDRLREMREKEQSKAAAHYQKTKATGRTPAPAQAQATTKAAPASNMKTPIAVSHAPPSRPGTSRMNTAARQQDPDSADEMPPPPAPKSLLPTGTGHKLREPKRLVKAPSKEAIPKGKPQKIQVNLHRDRFGQAPAASKPAPQSAPKMVPQPVATKPVPVAPKPAPPPAARPTAGSRLTTTAPKPAPKMGRTQPLKATEKPRPAPAQPRADLAAARPVSRMQTVQDAARINVPPVNPAKPPVKRPFQMESDESLHRPAKRPSQQARSKPVTPAHAQFAHGKIPFAEPSQPAQPTLQLPNGEDIKLPDIMTDSEDEDSENEFEQPSWVNTPNLRSMLEQQQLVDPEQIFGPIAPLNMEQVFPNKERHKRFRDRTSSAYWANDELTEEERRKEREARERLVREGAWTYNPSPRPGPQPQR